MSRIILSGAEHEDALELLDVLPLEHNARAAFPLDSNAYALCLDLGLDPDAVPVHVSEFGDEFGIDVAGEPVELVRLAFASLEVRQQALLVMMIADALGRESGEVRRLLLRRGLLVRATGAEVVRV